MGTAVTHWGPTSSHRTRGQELTPGNKPSTRPWVQQESRWSGTLVASSKSLHSWTSVRTWNCTCSLSVNSILLVHCCIIAILVCMAMKHHPIFNLIRLLLKTILGEIRYCEIFNVILMINKSFEMKTEKYVLLVYKSQIWWNMVNEYWQKNDKVMNFNISFY